MKTINTKRPSRLDLNAPLLTARRSNLVAMSNIEISRSNSLNNSCYRVPFLWEQSPGKPKDNANTENVVLHDKALPLPKPPPIRWQEDGENGGSGGGQGGDDGGMSGTVDLFSLAGSLNESDNDDDDEKGKLSPGFMIERFLPEAMALAESSLSALAGDKEVKPVYVTRSNISVTTKEGSCVPRRVGETYSSPKGCGLEMLLPWRGKHRVCGVKSPVRQPRPRLTPSQRPGSK